MKKLLVLFIGGSLDGELRELGAPNNPIGELMHVAQDGTPSTTTASRMYHIANGIARHESVSAEEVARMVKALMLTAGVTTWDMTKGAG